MSFPNELPRNAIAVLLDTFKSDKPDMARASLAVYDLAGYGLYLYFGDVKYLMGAGPEVQKVLDQLSELLSPENFPIYAEVAKFVAAEVAKGTRPVVIGLKVALKFGPQVAAKLLPLLKLLGVL